MKTAPIALIQLVSDEPMQAVLPMIALEPELVVQFITPSRQDRAHDIVRGARQAHWRGNLEDEPRRLSAMPEIGETCSEVSRAIEDLHRNGYQVVVNFTGGTKLMSIGAYQAARAATTASIYVDTGRSEFIDGETGFELKPLLGGDLHFGRFLRKLSVNAIAVSNGQPRVTGGRDWREYLRLALLIRNSGGRTTWEAFFGVQGVFRGEREPRSAPHWLPVFDRPIQVSQEIGDEAVKVGLLEKEKGQFFLPAQWRDDIARCSRHNYQQTVRPVQFATAFFTGGWWEVVVTEAADRSGELRDIRWSLNVGEYGGLDREEDVVAVRGASIAYISCKLGFGRGRLLAELDALDNRARSMGGRFTDRFLALYNAPEGRVRANLDSRARQLNGIRIITLHDLANPADTFK